MKIALAEDKDFFNHQLVMHTLSKIHQEFKIDAIIRGSELTVGRYASIWCTENGVTCYREYADWNNTNRKFFRQMVLHKQPHLIGLQLDAEIDKVLLLKPVKPHSNIYYNALAGANRNQEMLDAFQPNLVIAFGEYGNNASDMLRRARKAGIQILIVNDEESYKKLSSQPDLLLSTIKGA